MADASDSKSDEGDFVWVQVPSPALLENKGFLMNPPEKYLEDFFVLTSALILLTCTNYWICQIPNPNSVKNANCAKR